MASPLVASAPTKSPITPHIAYYKVKIEKVSKGIPISDLNGIMVLKMDNVCDGWIIEQKSSSKAELGSNIGEEQEQDLDSQYNVWESNQGNKLSFFSRRIHNKEEMLDIAGDSETKKNNTLINFNKPEALNMKTTSAILFPIKHLEKQIKAMNDGTKSISTLVFDGSSFGEPVKITTAFGTTAAKISVQDNNKKLHEIEAYPLNMSVFGANSDKPSFEIKQQMSKSGIMSSYLIDFGTYSLRGQLVKVEYLNDKKKC